MEYQHQQSYGEALIRAGFLYALMLTILVFWFFYCLTVLIAAPWISYPKRFELIYANYCRIVNWATDKVCSVNYVVEGLENLPQDRVGSKGHVIMSNHQSTWETLSLQTIFIPNAVILKKELLYVPFFGWCLAMLNPIFINRSDPATAKREVLEKGSERLRSGYDVLIFPEGTRVAPGDYKPFKKGGAMLAVEAGSDVIPVAHNAGEHWPNKGIVKIPGTIKVVIGPVITSEGKTAEQLNQEVENWILKTVESISADGDHFGASIA